MRLSHGFLIAAVAICAFAAQARADYFVWEDAKTGLSLSYPDTWRMINVKRSDDLIAVVAPAPADDAVCRIRARDDRRFLIYPPFRDKDVQSVAVGKAFWDNYLNEYDNVDLYGYTDSAGLGKGFGSFAVTGYDGAMIGPKAQRRGIAIAALYFGTLYIADCSAKATAFDRWYPQFLSLIGSIDFKKAHDELWTGNYRNFFADPGLEFKWPGTPVISRY